MTQPTREVTLCFLAEPSHVNFGGKVHGGAVMKWIDQAAYACAAGWSESYCVTVYVGGIRFYKPILIGNLVEVRAKVILTGTTSIHVAVDVFASDIKSRQFYKTTHCVAIFVAVDEAGSPMSVPTFVPETEEEHELKQYALKLMELRKDIDREMRPHLV